eukprot:gene24818-10468_t
MMMTSVPETAILKQPFHKNTLDSLWGVDSISFFGSGSPMRSYSPTISDLSEASVLPSTEDACTSSESCANSEHSYCATAPSSHGTNPTLFGLNQEEIFRDLYGSDHEASASGLESPLHSLLGGIALPEMTGHATSHLTQSMLDPSFWPVSSAPADRRSSAGLTGFDATIGSRNTPSRCSSFNSGVNGGAPAGPSMPLNCSQDPQVPMFRSASQGNLVPNKVQNTRAPSKLRNSSCVSLSHGRAPLGEADSSSVLDELMLAQQQQQGQHSSLLAEALKLLAAGGDPNTSLPMPGVSAMDPNGLLEGFQNQQQLQAMYMAAKMYNPFMQQPTVHGMSGLQALAALQAQASSMPQLNPYLGMGLMPGMMSGMSGGFGNPSLPAMSLPMMMNHNLGPTGGAMPNAGASGVPAGLTSTAEVAAYYRGMMEAQSAMASAMAGVSGGKDQAEILTLLMAATQQQAGQGGAASPVPYLGSETPPARETTEILEKIDEAFAGWKEEQDEDMALDALIDQKHHEAPVRHSSFSGLKSPGMPARRAVGRSTSTMDIGTKAAKSKLSEQFEGASAEWGMVSSSPTGKRSESVSERRPGAVDPVLDDFKNRKNTRFEFEDITGHVAEFSLDQHGSRFIQQKLETVSSAELGEALEEILPVCLTLVTDVFGNYVVQKFLEHGNAEQRMKVVSAVKGHVLTLSLQMYGCRVIQKALEVLLAEEQVLLIAEMDCQVMRCVRDQNGNHVVQKIIECVPTVHIQPLLDNLLQCVVQLSSHPFGCRVIQRILEHCQDKAKRGVVMDEIFKATCQLSQDQYGNYVIQHVIQHGSADERYKIVTELAPQIVPLSMHKFASNVVEKCLVHCNTVERDVLIKSMLGSVKEDAEEVTVGSDGMPVGEDPLQQMMKDQFGNYVVQKVLEVCDERQREVLLGRVRAQLHALKRFTYGKHIVARVEKLLSAGTRLQTSTKSRMLPDDSEVAAMVAAAAESADSVASSPSSSLMSKSPKGSDYGKVGK